MSFDSYKTLSLAVRPARVACLIDIEDVDWQRSVLHIIEFFSQVWGGGHFIIVPTDGATIPRVFWPILLSYDPDYIYVYRSATNTRVKKPALSEDLIRQLKFRLAPFHFQKNAIEGGITPGAPPRYPLTSLLTILPNCTHSSNIARNPVTPGLRDLWTASVLGRFSDEFLQQLNGIGLTPLDASYEDKPFGLFGIVTRGVLRLPTEEIPLNPFALSMLKLGS